MNNKHFDVEQSHNYKTLSIDKEKFNKSAKRLAKELNNIQEPNNKWSASQAQELLAKSFGFNNYHAVNHFYNNFDNNIMLSKDLPFKRSEKFLNSWSPEQIIKFFITLLRGNQHDMQGQRGIILITLVINILKYLSEKEELTISAETIAEYLNLNKLIKIYRQRSYLTRELGFDLITYLTSLPGFQESVPKQNDTVYEQHSYLQMQFISSIKEIQELEKADPLIINPQWYKAKYLKINIDKDSFDDDNIEAITSRALYAANNNNRDKKTQFFVSLDEKDIHTIASDFSNESWNKFFSEETLGKLSKYRVLYFVNQKDKYEYIFLEDFVLHSQLQYDSQVEDTWLFDKSFNSVLYGLIKNKNFKAYYFTDLLLYSFNIVNKEKQELYRNFLSHLMKNYPSTLAYSEYLNNIKL